MPVVTRFVKFAEIDNAPVFEDERKLVEGVRGRATERILGVDDLVFGVRSQIRRVLLECYAIT